MKNDQPLCPLAGALDLLGDRWSLVILRDMVRGKRRYGEFAASQESIPTNILASRLKSLEESGFIEKQPYQGRPVRYEYQMTEKGADLLPVLQSFAQWGMKHLPDVVAPPKAFFELQASDLLERSQRLI